MTTYYCDADGLFNNSLGTPVANKLNGPGGLRCAVTGDGNATALVAGDTVYVKGTPALDRYVELQMSAATAGWVTGDIVQNNNTGGGVAGDDWTGVLVENDAVGFILHVELALDKDLTDVNVADGVDNVTQAAQIAIDAGGATCEGFEIDNNSGGAGGLISIIATTDLTDPLNNPGQAVFDGGGVATYCINVTAVVTEWHLEGIDCINATSHGFYANVANSNSWEFYRCRFYDNGSYGMWAYRLYYNCCYQCVFEDNTASGMYHPFYAIVDSSRCTNNTAHGILSATISAVVNNIVAGNNVGIGAVARSKYRNNIIDNNATDGIRVSANAAGNNIIGNRITNNGDYGIDASDNACNPWEDYNVFHNNSSGDLLNTAGGVHSYGDDDDHIAETADDGYTNRTILVTCDTGTAFDLIAAGDIIKKDGTGWTMIVKRVTVACAGVAGSMTITFEAGTVANGNPANNNDFAITLKPTVDGKINGHPSVVFTGVNATDYNIAVDKEIRSEPIDLFWDA